MIKFFVIVLLSSLYGIFSMDSVSLSNEKPQKKLILSIQQSEFYSLNEEENFVKSTFSKKPYQELPLGEHRIQQYGFLFSFFCLVDLSSDHQSIFCSYASPRFCQRDDAELFSLSLHAQPSLANKKWAYPLPFDYWEGVYETTPEMSWNCIDLLLHQFFKNVKGSQKFYEHPLLQKLFKDIETYGIEKSLSRFLVFRDPSSGSYQYFSIYQKKLEHHKNIMILTGKKPSRKCLIF